MDLDKKRIVIKVGTSTITHEDGSINFRIIDRICRVLSEIESLGYKTVLVSSGAIGVGVNKLRLAEKPKDTRMKQAAAAVGQCGLMHIYDKFFGEYGRVEKIDENILSLAGGEGSKRGTGGMISKLDAANYATERGIDTLIILGQKPERLYDIIEGKKVGTLFVGRKG
ncbi:MAG: amino acid kinase family protein [Catonella sp.]|uniref:amino acid kinase family protein n=1 Tax=Catonella sp. TaxID=2382125 RepID=UPI003FA03E9E